MTKPLVSLQDLGRRIYAKAKAEPSWRFWGLFVHVCKRETLHEAYALARRNDGAPGVDGVSFAAIEESGVDGFLEQIRDELVSRRYVPMPNRRKEISKDGGFLETPQPEMHLVEAAGGTALEVRAWTKDPDIEAAQSQLQKLLYRSSKP
jgi:hypothetical protein